MKLVNIQNGETKITINFKSNSEYIDFRQSVINCIQYPKQIPLIDYVGTESNVIITSTYLANSLIEFVK